MGEYIYMGDIYIYPYIKGADRACTKHQRAIQSLGRCITLVSRLNPLMFGLEGIYVQNTP